MEKEYTLKTMLGDVTAIPKVLNTFICGNFAIAHKYEKEGHKELANMYKEEAFRMFNELEELTKGGE